MKTVKITDLKKELLVLELTEGATPEITPSLLAINMANGDIKIFKGDYTLLGKPDEIKEEDVSGFLEQSIFTSLYGHYVKDIPVNTYCYKTAIKSFNSALESEIYWSNPFENPDKNKGKYTDRFGDVYLGKYEEDFKQWKKAQEKTFDRNRTLIFIEN